MAAPIRQSQSPNSSHHPTCPHVLSLRLCLYSCPANVPLNLKWLLSRPAHIRSWTPTILSLDVPRVGVPPPSQCLWAMLFLCLLPSSKKPTCEPTKSTCPSETPGSLSPYIATAARPRGLQHRVLCVQNTKLPCSPCEPWFVMGTYLSAAHILRFTVSHARWFLQLLPAALHNLPLSEASTNLPPRSEPRYSSVLVNWLFLPGSSSPAQPRYVDSQAMAQGRTPLWEYIEFF